MRAVNIINKDGDAHLKIQEVPKPEIARHEVLIKSRATALNRADLLQRKGLYSPPPGESEILGLEVAGEIEAIGSEVTRWKKGDRVMAILGGGGYAAYVKASAGLLMPIPGQMDFNTAAGIPEAFLTAWQALHWLAKIGESEKILVHAGASGVGTAAIQLAREKNCTVIVTASEAKHALCFKLGASQCIDYKSTNFDEVLENEKVGVDVVLDFVGGPYLEQNMKVLNLDGRIIQIGLLGGSGPIQFDIGLLLRKRISLIGTTLRNRTIQYKSELIKDFSQQCLPLFETGKLSPVVDRVFNWHEVENAHQYMQSNRNQGKIILEIK